MADGYLGRLLVVDLTCLDSRCIPTPQWLRDEYVGGKGFAARLLYDLTPQGADPLGPENVLMFFTGPLTATAAPSMRACVAAKSPLTGLYLDSFFGGRFGPEIKYAGYDGLIVLGRAPEPTILGIHDDQVEFRPAGEIWGTDALTANALVKKEFKAPGARVATIGQAGETGVGFALVCCEYNRQAGRGGAGAVMGSKNLKAIAIQGSRPVKIHDVQAFEAACQGALEEIKASEACAALTDSGTSNAVTWAEETGVLPYRNHYDQVFPKAYRLSDVGQGRHIFLGKAACHGCPIRCSQMGAVRTGEYASFITDTVEYESAALMGSNLDIDDVRAVAHLVKLCDRYGLDSMSAGVAIAFAFEAADKKVIDSPAGIELAFGRVEAAEYLIRSIALQENELGRLLGQGVKKASRQLGRGSEAYALHVKGLEIPAWGPRGMPGMGLAYMTADRGACHQRGFMVAYEVGGEHYQGEPVSNYGLERKAEILKDRQDYLSGLDVLVKCDFGAFGVTAESYAHLLQAAVGLPVDSSFFNELGERIWNMVRLFNLREGLRIQDERLPRRFVEEPLPGGPHQGHRISKEDMAHMLSDYYRVRGWDENGRPRPETLEKLGLDLKTRFDPKL